MENNFWKEWSKLVIMLIGILIVWIGFIFICDKYFGKSFEEMRFIHYFLIRLQSLHNIPLIFQNPY